MFTFVLKYDINNATFDSLIFGFEDIQRRSLFDI